MLLGGRRYLNFFSGNFASKKPSKSTREGICKGVLTRDFVGKAGVHFPCSKTLRIYLALRISISAAIFHSTL
jgi:hypothetical protein